MWRRRCDVDQVERPIDGFLRAVGRLPRSAYRPSPIPRMRVRVWQTCEPRDGQSRVGRALGAREGVVVPDGRYSECSE